MSAGSPGCRTGSQGRAGWRFATPKHLRFTAELRGGITTGIDFSASVTLIGTDEDPSSPRPRTDTLQQFTAHAVPLGRPGKLDEVAAAILWLASKESEYVTGTELVIDGGRSIA